MDFVGEIIEYDVLNIGLKLDVEIILDILLLLTDIIIFFARDNVNWGIFQVRQIVNQSLVLIILSCFDGLLNIISSHYFTFAKELHFHIFVGYPIRITIEK